MDTISAFARGESARARGESMTYFDATKIKKLMEQHNVTEAEIFLESDREWTNTNIEIKNNKVIGKYMGVTGSIWATPMLDIQGEIFEVGTKNEKDQIAEWIQ